MVKVEDLVSLHDGRLEGRGHLAAIQLVPVNGGKEGMNLDVFNTIG